MPVIQARGNLICDRKSRKKAEQMFLFLSLPVSEAAY